MTSWEQRFYEFFADYLHEVEGWPVEYVTDIQEELVETGGDCDTCWSQEHVLQVEYVDFAGETKRATLFTYLADLFVEE